jgi:ATP-dependent helicase/nuclease subunit B
VAALLGSPLLRLGRAREAMAAAARALELGVLRGVLPPDGLANRPRVFARARAAAKDPHAHPAIGALSETDFAAAEALLTDLAGALQPLRDADGGPLQGLVTAHRAALAALAAPEEVGEAVGELLDEWALASGEGFLCGLDDYAAMFESLVATRAPPAPRGHPRLAILGLLEARLLHYDRVVLAGLDETVWPPAARTDAFLNRQMRADLRLSPPERRIGQTAQDFVIALQGRDVILTRARKRDGAPTVASRFLRRMEAFAETGATARALDRGARYLDFAHTLDRPETVAPAARPAPKPPVALRPDRLSVTRIETLRRDPYAIYAEFVLKLIPLPPIGPVIGPAEIGNVWHAALETFGREATPEDPAPRARLEAIAQAAFADLNAEPAFRALRWPRICEALDRFVEFDVARRAEAERIWIEAKGRLEIKLADGSMFTLSARADRIELGRGGLATVIDYKTGAPPGNREVEVGFAPQLTLEAAILKRGGFADIGALESEGAIYLKLGGADGGRPRPVKLEGGSFAETAEKHFAELKTLLDQLRSPDAGYLARPYPKFLARGTDYDHLARVAEWSLAESDET